MVTIISAVLFLLLGSLTPSEAAEENGNDQPNVMWNEKNVTGDAAEVRLIVGLTQKLLVETVERAASATPTRLATGVMDSGTSYPSVYSLAQCKPDDLSSGDCSACLRRLLSLFNSTMALRMGARMNVTHCSFRYDAYKFYDSQPMLRLGPTSEPPAPTPSKEKRKGRKLWAIPIVVVPLAAGASFCFILYSRRHKKQRKGSGHTQDLDEVDELVWEGKDSEFSVFEFQQILEATNNFSEEKKLGQGGFGSVYKGQLPEGMEIAVKRLASHSGQGFTEFKNEIQLIAKLQHRNLVRLLGCCFEADEKILVYEYLPNKSLDFLIFGTHLHSQFGLDIVDHIDAREWPIFTHNSVSCSSVRRLFFKF